MTINKSWETIVHKLAHALRQPAYLRPICDFYYLKLLPPSEEKKNNLAMPVLQ